jgi:hypothetical protein
LLNPKIAAAIASEAKLELEKKEKTLNRKKIFTVMRSEKKLSRSKSRPHIGLVISLAK